jgi:hypothetical protein
LSGHSLRFDLRIRKNRSSENMRPRCIDGLRNTIFYRNGTHVMSRKLILTKAALASIPELVASGLSRNEIAERLGCKPSTLKVRCSQSEFGCRAAAINRTTLGSFLMHHLRSSRRRARQS